MSVNESTKKYFAESLSWTFNNQVVAETGKLSPKVLKQFGIDQDVFYGHIEWDLLLRMAKNHSIRYRELPKYPAVKRDLALLVNSDVKFERIKELAFRTEKNILKEVNLFDVYESESLGKNKKSYAVSFILQDEMKTLTDKNIEKVMGSFIRIFEKELDAQIR
jgi:phenylalanyl-tRNA synthetase beta chain